MRDTDVPIAISDWTPYHVPPTGYAQGYPPPFSLCTSLHQSFCSGIGALPHGKRTSMAYRNSVDAVAMLLVGYGLNAILRCVVTLTLTLTLTICVNRRWINQLAMQSEPINYFKYAKETSINILLLN